jgi:hypothetical protein
MTIQLIEKARVEILLDEPLISRVVELLNRHQIQSYTIFPSSAGQGTAGAWQDDQITGAQHKVLLLTVADFVKAEALAADVEPLLDAYGMIFMLSPVKVIRASKF